jgi:hypothetical protein
MKKKFVIIFTIFMMFFALASCSVAPSTPIDDEKLPRDDTEYPDDKLVKDEKYTWNSQPVVKRVFYDDFGSGIDPAVWDVATGTWDKVSNGLLPENVMYSTYQPRVEAEDATGGIVVIKSNGDFAPVSSQQRQGGLLITKTAYGAGLYEARIKVVPRNGQCTALWTYWSNGLSTLDASRCSEIDIELPNAGDLRQWAGTVYSRYVDKKNKVADSVGFSGDPLNDGEWHTMSFEWRTNEETNDKKVIYYLDGEIVGVVEGESVPIHTATYWITSRFPDSIGWIGDPQYETAYMYVDWVRITEYDDPVQKGAVDNNTTTGPTGTDLETGVIPQTNYISNSQFVQQFTIKNMKNVDITSWETKNAQKSGASALISANGKLSQTITAQYEGLKFNLEVYAQVTGSGKCTVYVEFLAGAINSANPKFEVVGRVEVMDFVQADDKVAKNASFIVGGGDQVQSIRVVLESEDGTQTKIIQVRMFLE